MSVGIAFGLVWLFPAISFEIGVLIGTVSLGMIFYFFIKVIASLFIHPAYIDEDTLFDKIHDDIDLDNVILPKSTRSRRKRR
jgi:hypothetical protein